MRILHFYPLFIVAMNTVVLADDAFSFLCSWELMSVFSWALVWAYDYVAESRSAAYIYLLIASFGTLIQLIADSDDFVHPFRFYFDIVFL